jgi:hypothetical protein
MNALDCWQRSDELSPQDQDARVYELSMCAAGDKRSHGSCQALLCLAAVGGSTISTRMSTCAGTPSNRNNLSQQFDNDLLGVMITAEGKKKDRTASNNSIREDITFHPARLTLSDLCKEPDEQHPVERQHVEDEIETAPAAGYYYYSALSSGSAAARLQDLERKVRGASLLKGLPSWGPSASYRHLPCLGSSDRSELSDMRLECNISFGHPGLGGEASTYNTSSAGALARSCVDHNAVHSFRSALSFTQ